MSTRLLRLNLRVLTLFLLVSVPILSAISTATSAVTAYFLGLVPLVLLSGYCGLSAIFKAELYPVHVRALGVAVPYAIAQAIFGGNAEEMLAAIMATPDLIGAGKPIPTGPCQLKAW